MHIRSQQLGAGRGISRDMKTSWVAQEYDSTFTNLGSMARFQQKQLQEKEQKLLQLYDQQQQRAYQVMQRSSAGSNASNQGSTSVRTTTSTSSQGGKVRQMFDERRQTTVKGIDRSYPLEPLENKLRKQTNANGATATQRNGNLGMNRQSVSMKRMTRADVNSNLNGGKPVVSYHEEITRDSFEPFVRHQDDEDEFGVENRVANGHHRHDADELDEMFDQDAIERNRLMAKIHLMGFDETLKHRVRNDLESEEFPEYLMVDVPDKLPKKNITKKLSQAQVRLERFKNTIAKKNSVPKQSISTSTVIKKRSEQMEPARSNSQGNEIAGTSPTSVRSRTWRERSQRILANVKNPPLAETRMVDEMSKGRRKSSDVQTRNGRDAWKTSSKQISSRPRTCPASNEFKSLTSDGKIFIRRSSSPRISRTKSDESDTVMSADRKDVDSKLTSADRRSASPQFFCRENERSATTMSIDREIIDGSKPWSEWANKVHGKRNTDPRYFDVIAQQSPTTTSKISGVKSPEWDTKSSSKGSASPPYFFSRGSIAATSIGGSAARRESDWGEKIFAEAEAIPQNLSRRYERSETSTSIDRRSDLSESPLFYRETKQKANPRFFLHEFDQSPRTDQFNSSMWNKGTPRRDMNPLSQYFRNEFKQIGKIDDADRKSIETPKSLKRNKEMWAKQNVQYFDKKHQESNSVDRKTTVPSKSPLYEESVLKRRNTIPRYFCKESKHSATTTTIDHESGLPLYDRKTITKRDSSPQFFRKQSERSATTMSIDRKINESKSLPHDRKMLTKRSENPQYFNRKLKQQYATADTDKKYDRSKSKTATTRYNIRTISPQFFCKETDKSATTVLIKPRLSAASTAKGEISEQESDYSNTYKSLIKSSSSINKKMSPAQRRYIWDPSIAEREVKRNLKENEISATEMTRRSSRATSDSSVANLKYGLEFDSVFQSAELVRKFMKSREQRPSPTKRNIKNANALSTKDVQSRNRHGTPLLGQKTKSSPSRLEIKDEKKRATPESPRKSITPTEVDVEIQEIIMTDHRIERDRALRNVTSPISKRQTDGTFTKSSGGKTKFDTSITYPVRKTHRQRASILGPSVFKKESSSEKSRNRKGSTLSLSMLDNRRSETSRRVITRAEEDRENDAKTSETWSRSIKDDHKTEYVEDIPKKQHEDRQHSRSPIQMQSDTDNTRRLTKMMSSDLVRREQHSAISPILRENSSKEIQSRRLMRDVLKDSSPSIIEQDQRESENKQGNRTVNEVDAGIDAKYQTIVETALNRTIKNRRKIIGSHPANGIRNRDVQFRKGPRAMKSITAKKIISPKKSGKQHDIKASALSQTLSSRQTPKIARDTDISEISVLQRVVSKADRSSSPKFRTYTVKNSKYQTGTSHVKETTRSSDKINVKCGIEKSDNTNNTKGISKAPVQQEHKSENDFGRMDSVESALKRFDSIGAEFDHSDLVGFRASPDISLQTMNVQVEMHAKVPIISPESTTDSREETEDLAILKSASKCALDKNVKIKNDFTRKSDLKILRKETHFPKGLAKSKSLTGSKQRSMQTRSPMCKRQLFRSDVEKEISKNQLKPNHTKAHRKENDRSVNVAFRERKMSSKTTSLEREVTKKSKRLTETPGFSVKPLRSIEDIRKSIDKLTVVKESRPAIANRQSASREGVDTKESISATDAAKNVFSGGNPTRLTKVKSCVSRITKNPSPDVAVRKQHETNAMRTTRRHVLSSPSKSPDISSKNQETKFSRKSVIAKGGDSIGSKTATVDVVDTGLQNGSPHESPTKKSDAFVIDLDDQPSKESDAMPSKKPPARKSSSDQITSRGLGRPISSSSSSANSSQSSSQASNTKIRMATKFSNPSGPQIKKTFSAKSSGSSTDNLVSCSICKRNFSQDRINYHETICAKTTSKKRKQFNTKVFRVRGTELEPFVKEGFDKKQELKMKKPEVKSNWRRKHEDFINAIRYAKQVQAHVAAGGNPNDIPPPPSSDTSDYIQCPHCGRKFNQMAAERHIPKCENMRHNKPAFSRAPRPRR